MREVAVTIQTETTHQTMDGFGACLVSHMTPVEYLKPEFYDMMVYDLGTSIVRINVPASLAPVNDDDDPDHFNWDAFDHRDFNSKMAFLQEFKKRGVRTFFASLWSPPGWMKTNRNVRHGGRLRPDMREKFAKFWAAAVITAKRDFDIDLCAISLQNELHFIEPYDSCVYNPEQIRKALSAVVRKFRKEGLDTLVMVPEEMGFSERFLWYARGIMAEKEVRDMPWYFCSHGGRRGIENWQQLWGGIKDYGRRLWMTETGAGRGTWESAMVAGQRIHNAIAGGNISAWVYWQFMHLEDDCKPKPSYWPSKHFFRFVRPGAVRVEAASADADLLASAYTYESGALACVLINTAGTPAKATLNLQGAQGLEKFRLYRSSESEQCAVVGELARVAAPEIEMPARSIVTVLAFSGDADREIVGPGMPEAAAEGEAGIAAFVPTKDEKLHNAARTNQVARVQELIAEGWDVDAPNIVGSRPLHRAAWPGHTDAIAPLVEAGANVNLRDNEGATALHISAYQGFLDFVKELLGGGADPNVPDIFGWTPMHCGALSGNDRVMEALLDAGGEVNATANDGATPLHAVAGSPYPRAAEALKVLIAAGGDASAAAADGWTPLHSAAANLHTGYRVSVGMAVEKVRVLVGAGADVNVTDDGGRTPLHWAAWVGHDNYSEDRDQSVYFTGAVQALIEAGADVNAADNNGRTPLLCAVEEQYGPIAAVLMTAGADVHAPDKEGRTPLSVAEVKDYGDILEMLRTGEVPKGMLEGQETTAAAAQAAAGEMGKPLRQAAGAGKVPNVRKLLNDGADVNDRGLGGRTALHVAVMGGHLQVVRALVVAGADVTIMNTDGYTALDLAEQNGQTEIVAMLKAALAEDE